MSYRFVYPSIAELNGSYAITSGKFVPSSAWNSEEIFAENGRQVSLPDDNSIIANRLRRGWYVFSLDVSVEKIKETQLCLYFPKVSQNIEVFVNNHWIGNAGRMKPSVYRNRNYPLLFFLDKKSLFKVDNEIKIHLAGQAELGTYLGRFYLGTEENLLPIYEKNKVVRVNLIFFTTTALLSFSFFLGILWALRKKETYYLWFSLAAFLWAIHDANNFWRIPVVPDLIWEAFVPLSFGWSIVFMMLFLHGIEGGFNKKIAHFILSAMILLSVPFLYPDMGWVWFYGYQIWFYCVALVGAYNLFFLFSIYRIKRKERTFFMFLTGISILFFGIHDLLVVTRFFDPASPFLLHFSALLVLIVISKIVLSQFVDGMNVMENYNTALESDIRQKKAVMEKHYLQIQDLQRKRILFQERERIMRDMHDGIGGNLVSIIASIESPHVGKNEIKTDIHAALQDLRIMIDSLDNSASDLLTVLGMLRMRLAEQLRYAELKLEWCIEDLPDIEHFGPEKALHTMRIVQEAVSNVIKHSGAKTLKLSTYVAQMAGEKHAVVEIRDNGYGVIPDVSRGRGLSNMRYRAEKIKAYLRIDPVPQQGVVITLAFPINTDRKNP
ncbi:MAG: hypothetical protein R3E93_06535 [Thiothrix sp.]